MRSEQDYQAAADWAEHEMDLSRATGGTVHYGAAAAAHGRALLEQAAGGPAELEKALRGRPSIDPDAGPGNIPGSGRSGYRPHRTSSWTRSPLPKAADPARLSATP